MATVKAKTTTTKKTTGTTKVAKPVAKKAAS